MYLWKIFAYFFTITVIVNNAETMLIYQESLVNMNKNE